MHSMDNGTEVDAMFFFKDTATTEIYTLSLHDALPIWPSEQCLTASIRASGPRRRSVRPGRSEEHTSELQSRRDLVCRLLLEKKKCRASLWCSRWSGGSPRTAPRGRSTRGPRSPRRRTRSCRRRQWQSTSKRGHTHAESTRRLSALRRPRAGRLPLPNRYPSVAPFPHSNSVIQRRVGQDHDGAPARMPVFY